MKYNLLIISVFVALFSCASPQSDEVSESPTDEEAATTTLNTAVQFSVNSKTAIVYTTAEGKETKMEKTEGFQFANATQPMETEISIFVNTTKQFQEFLGIGGAITDAAAETFAKLSPDKQQQFLEAYYGEKGNNYNIVRTHINSCDFSSNSYTYIEEGDAELNSFSIEPDKQFRIPLIKKALEMIGENAVFYVSPWSPPAFMKDNKNMLKGGKLLPEFHQAWANYFVKFIKAYEAEGMKIWGLTVQNEPMATQTWESCIYTAEEERDFVKNFLGPTLEKEGLGDKNIVVWDHNRDLIVQRANAILNDTAAAKYVWGVGFHWYETWTGAEPAFANLEIVKENFPDKNLLFTEGCNERFDAKKYQLWKNAERYGKSMINDFNAGTCGWTDWNVLLDETGGPNHVGNFCFAPIHADTRTNELIFTPSYYYIGHFSRFIEKGAHRVSTASSRSTLISTSFLNNNGTMVTVVMNETDKKEVYKLQVDNSVITVEIPAHAIQTIVY